MTTHTVAHGRRDQSTSRRRLQASDGFVSPGVTVSRHPPDELNVFERGETSPLGHASGLDLWLVHRVVNEFGGAVTVSSTDRGTEITLMMPIIEHLEPTE